MGNKNLNEQMARILNGLNDEQKEKAMACKTLDELMSLLSELRIAIPDELLDNVAGGGDQEDLEMVYKLSLWDYECQRRGIGVHDTYRRDQVWRELFPNG